MPVNGLVTMTPTSIASTGTGNSSSINTNGSVTFSACATLSLNGVFTSSYDNYMIVCRETAGTNSGITFRLRLSGTDNSTSSSYTAQTLDVNGTSLVASRTSSTNAYIATLSNAQRSGFTAYFFGPQLAQATAWRSVDSNGGSNAYLYESAGTHNQATGYDGITLTAVATTFTGLVTVYGFNQ